MNETMKVGYGCRDLLYSSTIKTILSLIQMGMKCNMETLIGQEPETKFDVTKISLKPVAKS
jgi:hypothetical protein